MTGQIIERRTWLGSAGAAVLLPLLESTSRAAGGPAQAAPKRLIFLNFGFGPTRSWYPAEPGADYRLTDAMKPLKRHRDVFSPISNLTNIQSASVGAHSGATTFLTGADVRRTPGRAFHNSVSCDQAAAAHVGKNVRFPSLVLNSPSTVGKSSGYGPGASLSWDAEGNPIHGEADHVVLFDRIFGDGGLSIERRRQLLGQKQSVLDAVRHDARAVQRRVNATDRDKIEEYFSTIRGLERKLARTEQWLDRPKPEAPLDEPASNLTGTPGVELTFDLMTAALQTDSTRIITYRMPTTSLLREFGAETKQTPVSAHAMSHSTLESSVGYQQAKWRERKLCSLFGVLLDKLKAVREKDGGTLLDNTLVVMGSGIRAGHGRKNLPILLAGGGADVRHGQHYVYKESETPLANLWLSMLNYAGCSVESFADSDGVLSEIFVGT